MLRQPATSSRIQVCYLGVVSWVGGLQHSDGALFFAIALWLGVSFQFPVNGASLFLGS